MTLSFRFLDRRSGFTLIELLVVIGVIAVIAAVLYPVFSKAREKARAASCLSNYHQIGMAMHMYSDDYDGTTPPDGGSFSGLIADCAPYNERAHLIFVCPDDYDRVSEARPGSYRMASDYQGKLLICGWDDPYNPGHTAQPSTTTLTYEAEKDFAQSPIIPTYRHSDGTQFLLFDGHTRWIKGTPHQDTDD